MNPPNCDSDASFHTTRHPGPTPGMAGTARNAGHARSLSRHRILGKAEAGASVRMRSSARRFTESPLPSRTARTGTLDLRHRACVQLVRRRGDACRAGAGLLAFILLFLLSPVAVIAANNSLTDEQLLQIKFDQKLNSQVSPDLTFIDETGKRVQLGDYFGKRPIVLVLGYYTCPMLCTLVMDGAIESFRDLKWTAGQQFEVIFVSIDPKERPPLAAQKKKTYLRDYGRGTGDGWHFLTDATAARPDKAVQKLADEIGFRFAYDAGLKEYAHPSGFVVLTPEGRVSHYFFGVTFSPQQVDAALRSAADQRIGSPVQEFILLCCEYSPLRGKYGKFVLDAVRVGGVAMVIGLGVMLLRPPRAKKEAPK